MAKYPHIKLDRSKPIDQVYPPYLGAHFHQDGLHFDAHGTLVEHPELFNSEHEKAIADRERKARAKKAADEAYARELARIDAERNAKSDPDGELDLAAWAKGEVKAPWHVVAKQIVSVYGVPAPTDKAAAMALLVEKGVITLDDIKG